MVAAQYVSLAVWGDGGDELFAGYDKYVIEGRERRSRLIPAAIRQTLGLLAARLPEGARGRNFLHHFSLGGPERYLDSVTLFRNREKEGLFERDALELLNGSNPFLDRMNYLNRSG